MPATTRDTKPPVSPYVTRIWPYFVQVHTVVFMLSAVDGFCGQVPLMVRGRDLSIR